MRECRIEDSSDSGVFVASSAWPVPEDCEITDTSGAGILVEIARTPRPPCSRTPRLCRAARRSNGRYAREVLDGMVTRQAGRHSTLPNATTSDLCLLLPADL